MMSVHITAPFPFSLLNTCYLQLCRGTGVTPLATEGREFFANLASSSDHFRIALFRFVQSTPHAHLISAVFSSWCRPRRGAHGFS